MENVVSAETPWIPDNSFKMNTKHHIHTSTVQCPYCDQDQESEDAPRVGEEITHECQSCEKKFSVSADVVYTTYSLCEENGEEHKFYRTSLKGFWLCENCEGCRRDP